MNRCAGWISWLLVLGVAACDDGGTSLGGDIGPSDTPDESGDSAADADADPDVPVDGTEVPVDGTEVPADVPVEDAPTEDVAPEICGGATGYICPDGEVCDVRSCGDGATGFCVTRPEDCPAIYAPVCGCDGVTYGSDCQRLQAAADLDHDGECTTTDVCGGSAGYRCPDGQACDWRDCAPGATGTCVVLPATCPDAWAPVCGCDGASYASECRLLAANAGYDHDGLCSSGAACTGGPGGGCGMGAACDIAGCAAGTAGTCVELPRDCPTIYEPVCGCNGLTYENECLRLRARAALDHAGTCGSGTACGGIAGIACPAGEVCDVRECGDDMMGTCVPAPPEPCPRLYAPVCGCDGVNYDNDCLRLTAGVDYDHAGACAGTVCTPECRMGPGGRSGWVDPCTGALLCAATCTDCTATCEAIGTRSEGWYAACSSSGIDAGCGLAPNLINWYDCG